MATLPIVKDLDVLKNGLLSLLERLVGVQICPFSFEGTNEALHGSIVVAIALPTHADLDASLCCKWKLSLAESFARDDTVQPASYLGRWLLQAERT
jgi:hypothetical protein